MEMVLGKGHRGQGGRSLCSQVSRVCLSFLAEPAVCPLTVRSLSHRDNHMLSPAGSSSESADEWVFLGDGLYASAQGKVSAIPPPDQLQRGRAPPPGWLPTSEKPHFLKGLRGPTHRSAALNSDPDGRLDPVRASPVSASQSKRNW